MEAGPVGKLEASTDYKAVFKDPARGLWFSKEKYEGKVKDTKEMKEYIDRQPVREIALPATRSNEFIEHITAPYPGYWQIDLLLLEWSDDIVYIFNAVDIFSRYGFSTVMQDKSAECSVEALNKLIKLRKVYAITTDNGTEFVNNAFESTLASNSIKYYVNFAGDHHTMGVVERYNRTLRLLFDRAIKLKLVEDMESFMESFMRNYNSTVHSFHGATPEEVYDDQLQQIRVRRLMDDDIPEIFKTDIGKLRQNNPSEGRMFNDGDKVRVLLRKGNLLKHQQANWSSTLYEVKRREGTRYAVQPSGVAGKVLLKKAIELRKSNVTGEQDITLTPQKLAPIDTFTADRILGHSIKKNGVRYLVQWEGYTKEEATWEPVMHLRGTVRTKFSLLEKEYLPTLTPMARSTLLDALNRRSTFTRSAVQPSSRSESGETASSQDQ